jgi:hypothetical protein
VRRAWCSGDADAFGGVARAALKGDRQPSKLRKNAEVTSNLKRIWRFYVTVCAGLPTTSK